MIIDNLFPPKKLNEAAPPGARAERMVKHIKAGYAKDGKLTPKEKGIAYATAWKAHNAGRVEEGEYQDDYEDEQTELCNGCYVRDKEDSSGEIFVMRGDPGDRRVRIEDRHGRGWNIAPYRLTVVDDSDPDIADYFSDELDEAGVTDPTRAKLERMIYKYYGQIYDYGDDDGLDYLARNGELWNQLMDKYDGEIEDIVAREPTEVLMQAAQELKGIAGDMKYELDEQGVAEGFEPGHREIERWATQSEENQKIYNAYIKAGKMADEAYKQKDGAAYTGLQLRRKQIRDLIADKMSEQGVTEGYGQKPTITYKDLTLQYDYQTEDDDPEGYSTATTYYFDVFKDGKRVGEAEYFDYFGNLKIRIHGKTKEFGFRHPLTSQISQLVSSLPDEQKKDLSDPRFESQGVSESSKPTKKEYLKKLDQNRKDIEDTRQKGVYGAPGSLKNVDWVKKKGVAEGSIKDVEAKIRAHDQRKADREQAGDPYVAHELHSHNVIRKQLLDKRKKAQAEYHKKMDQQGVAEGIMVEFGAGAGFPKTPKYKVGDEVYVWGYQGRGKIAYIKNRQDVGVIIKEPAHRRVHTTIDDLMPIPTESYSIGPEQGMEEGYKFKGGFPFDVDHMHGSQGINLPSVETKRYFTDKQKWEQTVDELNHSLYDDNSEFIGATGRSSVTINGREWARWSDARQKGYVETKPLSQDMAEGSTSHAELAKMAHDAYVAASRKGNGPMAAHYLKQYQKHKADTAKVTKGVAKGSEAVCPRCHSSDIKTYSDGEKECNHCHRTWDVQGVTEGLTEMDKSQPSAGRDTGPRPGPDREAKPITAKKATKDAADMLNRAVKDSHKKKDVKESDTLMLKLERAMIREGRVKELADDLKTMSDSDFMKKYGKAKAAIRRDMKQLDEAPVNELSTEKLAQYKTAAAKDAKKADQAGDFKRGDKRFHGMVQATKKQFDKDAKKVDESRAARRALMAQIVNGG